MEIINTTAIVTVIISGIILFAFLMSFLIAMTEYYFLKWEIQGLDDRWLQVNLLHCFNHYWSIWLAKPFSFHEEDYFADSKVYNELIDYRNAHHIEQEEEERTQAVLNETICKYK